MKQQSRFVFKHSLVTNEMLIICTQDIVGQIDDMFNRECPIYYMQATRRVEDSINDDGDVYENCIVIRFNVPADVVEIFFDAAKTMIRESILKSINHNDN